MKFFMGFIAGIVVAIAGIGIFQDFTTPVEATVQGMDIVNRTATDADFRIFKASNNSIEVKTVDVNTTLKGQDKGNSLKLAEASTAQLQFLLNHQQTLASIQECCPCPAPETCDSDLLADPAGCTIFWEDLDPKVDHPFIEGEPADTLTSRGNFVTVTWDGFSYNLGIRSVHRDGDYPEGC